MPLHKPGNNLLLSGWLSMIGDSISDIAILTLILWTFKDNNSSRKFYEKLGGEIVDQVSTSRGDHQYIEVAYMSK